MDWSRFKNIAIIIFIAMNIILCVLISEKKNKNYVMQDSQIRRLQSIYEKENAALYTNVPKEFYPMSTLKMSVGNVDDEEVCRIFFGDNNVKRYVNDEKVTYQKEGKGQVIIYKNENIRFTNNIVETNSNEIDKEQARREADKYVNKLSFLNLKYIYTQSNTINDEYIIEYNSLYKGDIVLSNYIKVHFRQNQVSQIDISRFNINGYTNEQREIASADEVLINLLFTIKPKYDENFEEMHVMDLSLGYYVDSANINDYLNIKAEPYYRIQVNEKDVYFINAYTNEILNR